MSKTDLSPIEEKKKNLDNSTNKETNKWLQFGISIIMNLLIVSFIGIIGANFIYMTTATNKIYDGEVTLLEKLLPTEESHYFPPTGAMRGGSSCSSTVDPSPNWTNLNNIGIGKNGGWPYSMYKEGTLFNGITQNFKNWFAESVADSYMTNRGLLQKWLALFAPVEVDKNIFSNETFQIFIMAPLMLLIFPLLIFFIYFSTWFSAFKSGWVFTLFGMFFIYSWVTTSTVSFIQCMQYLLTFLCLPIFVDYKRIKKIINCNIKSLSLFFGLLICGSAVSYLDNTVAITMFVVYLIMVIKSFW